MHVADVRDCWVTCTVLSLRAAVLEPGTQLGKYEVLRMLGHGSSGTTYQARGPDGEQVAVKAVSLRSSSGWKQVRCGAGSQSSLGPAHSIA